MKYTQPQLDDVAEYAGLFFTIEEIGTILDVPLVEFRRDMANPETDVHRAYLRGKLMAQASVRKTVKKQAVAGSTPAIGILQRMMEGQELGEKRNKELYGNEAE